MTAAAERAMASMLAVFAVFERSAARRFGGF